MTISEKQIANKLIDEKSPYLLQHAYNPVNWFPWGEEAFQKAKNEDKPVFLSIGYSTCHWCHVMERESFEDMEVANILNEKYISIKVDREERPDIDNIYMNVCTIMTNSGGWPLTIIMTPEQKPFFAGTYFPKRSNYKGQGLIDILLLIDNVWKSDRDQINIVNKKVMSRLDAMNLLQEQEDLNINYIHNCYKILEEIYEPEFGGFSNEPKFPLPHYIIFLLRYYSAFGNNKALEISEKTLKSMYRGGIYDHVGKGFSRYSTDSKWLVPHFEKMLYDNALLIYAYTEAYLATKKELYKKITVEIIQYVTRELRNNEGAFYCAEDADSEGEEGKYYLWTLEEIYKVLGNEKGHIYSKIYGITNNGNYNKKNILNLLNYNENINEEIEEMNKLLLNYRKEREHPFKDDKILCGWNGLMIAALSYAGRVFNEPNFIEMAEQTSDFICKNLMDQYGKLYTRYRQKEKSPYGFVEDYAYFIWGLIELYEATLNEKYIQQATILNEKMIELFEDKKNGGMFYNSIESEQLIYRSKEVYDGAMPSGNSVAACNMIRIASILENQKLNERAYDLIKCFSYQLMKNPAAYCFLNTALLQLLIGSKEICIVGSRGEAMTEEMIKKINQHYLPFATIALISENNSIIPKKEKLQGKVTCYICNSNSCSEPVTTIDKLIQNLNSYY